MRVIDTLKMWLMYHDSTEKTEISKALENDTKELIERIEKGFAVNPDFLK